METINCKGHDDISPLYYLTEERARELAHHIITNGGFSWPVIYTANLFYEDRLDFDFDELGHDFIRCLLDLDTVVD